MLFNCSSKRMKGSPQEELNDISHTRKGNYLVLSKVLYLGGSPGLEVMGGGSRSKGRGFESRRRILDGHDIFNINLL